MVDCKFTAGDLPCLPAFDDGPVTDARDAEEERGEVGKLDGEAVDLNRNVHLVSPWLIVLQRGQPES